MVAPVDQRRIDDIASPTSYGKTTSGFSKYSGLIAAFDDAQSKTTKSLTSPSTIDKADQ